MAPKKSQLVAEVPNQFPPLSSIEVAEALLRAATGGRMEEVHRIIALSLNEPHERQNLRGHVEVAFLAEGSLFCAQQRYGPLKTLRVLTWLQNMKHHIDIGDSFGARSLFKGFLVQSVKDAVHEHLHPKPVELTVVAEPTPATRKDGKRQPKGNAGVAAGGSATNASFAGGPATATGASACDSSEWGSTAPPRQGSQHGRQAENGNVGPADAGPLGAFVVRGLMQHAELYHYVAAECLEPTPSEVAAEPPHASPQACTFHTFTLSVETPMTPWPLSAGVPGATAAAEAQAKAQALDDGRQAQIRQEDEALREQRQVAAACASEEQALLEENRVCSLFFEKEGTQAAVEAVYDDLAIGLAKRQWEILQRIGKVEKELDAIVGLEKAP